MSHIFFSPHPVNCKCKIGKPHRDAPLWDEQAVVERKKKMAAIKAKVTRQMKESALSSLGMTKVRGNLGGTYWE